MYRHLLCVTYKYAVEAITTIRKAPEKVEIAKIQDRAAYAESV